MKRLLIAIALTLIAAASAAAAPTLSWDTVNTATDGSILANGMEVKSYEIYRCRGQRQPLYGSRRHEDRDGACRGASRRPPVLRPGGPEFPSELHGHRYEHHRAVGPQRHDQGDPC